jgi:hypothetical protein
VVLDVGAGFFKPARDRLLQQVSCRKATR